LPKRDLQLEARVGVVELVAEQFAEAGVPVASRLRVDLHLARHGGIAVVADVGQGRFAH
jgi:hypothetical protein